MTEVNNIKQIPINQTTIQNNNEKNGKSYLLKEPIQDSATFTTKSSIENSTESQGSILPKVAIGLGVIGLCVGGYFLHKRLSAKNVKSVGEKLTSTPAPTPSTVDAAVAKRIKIIDEEVECAKIKQDVNHEVHLDFINEINEKNSRISDIHNEMQAKYEKLFGIHNPSKKVSNLVENSVRAVKTTCIPNKKAVICEKTKLGVFSRLKSFLLGDKLPKAPKLPKRAKTPKVPQADISNLEIKKPQGVSSEKKVQHKSVKSKNSQNNNIKK